MEVITIITALIIIVFGVLQIVLFFKVWGMTDDVKQITLLLSKKMLAQDLSVIAGPDRLEKESVGGEEFSDGGQSGENDHIFSVGQHVVIKSSGNNFKISSIEVIDGETMYYSDKYKHHFRENQLIDYDIYWRQRR